MSKRVIRLYRQYNVTSGEKMKHADAKATAKIKEIGEYLCDTSYASNKTFPKSFVGDKCKFVIERKHEYSPITVSTYSIRTGKLLCRENLQMIEVLFQNKETKFIECEVVTGKAKNGLFAKFDCFGFSQRKNVQLNNESIDGYIIRQELYSWPFTKTEVSKIVSSQYSFAGYEYRIGKNHYYHVPVAESATKFAY